MGTAIAERAIERTSSLKRAIGEAPIGPIPTIQHEIPKFPPDTNDPEIRVRPYDLSELLERQSQVEQKPPGTIRIYIIRHAESILYGHPLAPLHQRGEEQIVTGFMPILLGDLAVRKGIVNHHIYYSDERPRTKETAEIVQENLVRDIKALHLHHIHPEKPMPMSILRSDEGPLKLVRQGVPVFEAQPRWAVTPDKELEEAGIETHDDVYKELADRIETLVAISKQWEASGWHEDAVYTWVTHEATFDVLAEKLMRKEDDEPKGNLKIAYATGMVLDIRAGEKEIQSWEDFTRSLSKPYPTSSTPLRLPVWYLTQEQARINFPVSEPDLELSATIYLPEEKNPED